MEHADDSLFEMLDDDIELRKRYSESPTKRPYNRRRFFEFYDTTIEWLNTDCTLIVIRRITTKWKRYNFENEKLLLQHFTMVLNFQIWILKQFGIMI